MPDPPPLGKGSGPPASARSRRLRSTRIHEIVRLTSALQVTGARAVEAHGVVVHFDATTTNLPDADQAAKQQHGSHQAAGELSRRAEKRRERSRRRAAERARTTAPAVPPEQGCGQQQQHAAATAELHQLTQQQQQIAAAPEMVDCRAAASEQRPMSRAEWHLMPEVKQLTVDWHSPPPFPLAKGPSEEPLSEIMEARTMDKAWPYRHAYIKHLTECGYRLRPHADPPSPQVLEAARIHKRADRPAPSEPSQSSTPNAKRTLAAPGGY